MTNEGNIVLFRFPQTDQSPGKLRPALVLRKLPGRYNDWLICMISTQLQQNIADFDEIITESDPDFNQSGLKLASVIRISRLAVVNDGIFLGALGRLDNKRLRLIRRKLSEWIQGTVDADN